MSDKIRYNTVTIAGGASLSGAAVVPDGCRLVAVQTEATWDAAKVTFQVSVDETNYFNLLNAGTEYEVAAITGAAFAHVDHNVFHGARKIKVRSGTSAAAVAQADATIVTLVYWEIE